MMTQDVLESTSESDSLGRILRSLRLRSTMLSRADLTNPWGVSTKGLVANKGDNGAAMFHAVVAGRAELTRGNDVLHLEEGDVALLSRGDAHQIASDVTVACRPINEMDRIDGGVPLLVGGGGGARTRILCGAFVLDHAAGSSFLSLLPPVIHFTGNGRTPANSPNTQAAWVAQTLALIDMELDGHARGADAMVTRLCDVLFLLLLRGASTRESHGWLASLHDKHIGKALALIHEDPRTRWDAAVLAERVGMSRSRFFARFTELVGEPPAQYLSRWRATVAADLLRRRDMSVHELAELAGYSNEEAFARMFRKHMGLSPSEYRRTLKAG
jgi:AraC-like DNA-binding protein